MICPLGTMAIEPASVEINLREPRKSERDFSALLWLCGWGVATAVALSALAITNSYPRNRPPALDFRSQRTVRRCANASAHRPARIGYHQMLTEQVRALNADRDRLAGRIALLQSSVDDMTGAIKRQAAAAAAVLAARAAAPASQPQPSIAPAVASATPVTTAPKPKPIPSSPHLFLCRPHAPRLRRRPPGRNRLPARRVRSRSRRRIDAHLQQRWTTVKANFGPLLSNLHPLAAPERRQGKRATGSWSARCPTARPPPGSALTSTRRIRLAEPSTFEGEQIAQR